MAFAVTTTAGIHQHHVHHNIGGGRESFSQSAKASLESAMKAATGTTTMGAKVIPDGEEERNRADSNVSTATHDRDGVVKITTFLPPSKYTDAEGNEVILSVPARIWMALENPAMGTLSKIMSVYMMLLIFASCVGFVIATVPTNTYVPTEASDNPLVDCDGTRRVPVLCSTCWDDGERLLGGNCAVCESIEAEAEDGDFTVCEPAPFKIFDSVEAFCIYMFTIDYLLRIFTVFAVDAHEWGGDDSMTSCGSKIYNYATGTMNIIDVVAIMPFWLGILFGGDLPLGFLRVLRLARVFRIFKLGKYNEGMSLFSRTLHASIPALSLLCFFVLIGVVLFGSIIYFVEGGTFIVDADLCPVEVNYACYVRPNSYNGDALEISPFRSIPYSFYWVMVTMTTVGYGDQYAHSGLGKFVTILCMLAGILTLALPITVLGSNFSSEYDKMHGNANEDEMEKEEEKFWEHFAGLVAGSMIEEGNVASAGLDKNSTRQRLRSMILEQSSIPASLAQEDSTGSPKVRASHSIGKLGGKGQASPVYRLAEGREATVSTIAQLEQTILQLQATVDGLKRGVSASSSKNGDMSIQDFSPRDSVSPDPASNPKRTAVSKYEVQGSINPLDFSMLTHCEQQKKRTKSAAIETSGSGSVPCAFHIFSPTKMSSKDRKGHHFSPNASPRVEEAQKDKNAPWPSDDPVNEAESILSAGASAVAPGKLERTGSGTLNLRTGGISNGKSKLLKLGKSFKWGQSFMTKKKNFELIGETERKLEITVVSASGIECNGEAVAFTVVAGGTQFETKAAPATGLGGSSGELVFEDSKFMYAVPLSTHSGDLLVKNLEVIAHCGERIVSTTVIPLSSVSGCNVEYRLRGDNNHYIQKRRSSITETNAAAFAGAGRVTVYMAWANVPQGTKHKFGTSFGGLLSKGAKFGATDKENVTEYRSPPAYPKLKRVAKRKSSANALHIADAGEEFFFEECLSSNSSSLRGETPLLFPDDNSNSNSTPSFNSPTQSPGRSDSELSDGQAEVVRESSSKEHKGLRVNPAKKTSPIWMTPEKIKSTRAQLVEDFLHNGHGSANKYAI